VALMAVNSHRLKRIRGFMQISARELRAARLLAEESPEDAMFLLQQATEKLVRAAIEAENGVAGITHNIRALTNLLPKDHELLESFKPLDDLGIAATRYRYPTSGGTVFEADEDVSAVIRDVEMATKAVSDFLIAKELI
jgi:HEPN domain-containing protein